MEPPNNGTFNPTVRLCNPIHIHGKLYTPVKKHYIPLSKNIIYPCKGHYIPLSGNIIFPCLGMLYTPVKDIIYPCHETLCSRVIEHYIPVMTVIEHYIPVMKHYVPLS